jgi:hypothetical protein
MLRQNYLKGTLGENTSERVSETAAEQSTVTGIMKHFNLLVFFIAALAIRNSSSYCPVCSLKLRKIQEARLKVIQKEILDKLGLIHAPNITRRGIPKIPPVLKLMESERNHLNAIPDNFEEDNYHAKTQRIILFPEKGKELA